MPHVELPQVEFKVVILGDTNTGKTSLLVRFVSGHYSNNGSTDTHITTTKNNNTNDHDDSNHHNHNQHQRESTIGAYFVTKRMTCIQQQNMICKLLLWDTSGHEQYMKFASIYYQNAAVAILTYDITQSNTIQRLIYWLDELHRTIINPTNTNTNTNNQPRRMVLCVAACKCDLLNSNNNQNNSNTEKDTTSTSTTTNTQHKNQQQQQLQYQNAIDEGRRLAEQYSAIFVCTSSKENMGISFLFEQICSRVLQYHTEFETNHTPSSNTNSNNSMSTSSNSNLPNIDNSNTNTILPIPVTVISTNSACTSPNYIKNKKRISLSPTVPKKSIFTSSSTSPTVTKPYNTIVGNANLMNRTNTTGIGTITGITPPPPPPLISLIDESESSSRTIPSTNIISQQQQQQQQHQYSMNLNHNNDTTTTTMNTIQQQQQQHQRDEYNNYSNNDHTNMNNMNHLNNNSNISYEDDSDSYYNNNHHSDQYSKHHSNNICNPICGDTGTIFGCGDNNINTTTTTNQHSNDYASSSTNSYCTIM